MTCPFCGVESDVAHETQQGCIDALRVEILRVRDILQNVRTFEVPDPPEQPDDPAGVPEDSEIEHLF